MSSVIDSTARKGMGQGFSSHPLHPATVHVPIGLLSLSLFLDSLRIVPTVASGLNAAKLLPPATAMSTVSHYVGAGGLIFAVLSVLTGLSELYGMWYPQTEQKGSVTQTLKDAAPQPSDIPSAKLKTALTHATLNDVVVGVAAWNWWVRRKAPALTLPRTNAIAAGIALPLSFYSAYLGGELVYEYGMGVQRQGASPEVKDKMQKSS
ncbi:hypothetical protein JCM10212_002814 [Sporobolomyces blumeae]